MKKELFQISEAMDILWRDLAIIHEIAQQRGVRLVLLTYAAFPLPHVPPSLFRRNAEASNVLRKLCQSHGLDVVDLRDRFTNLLGSRVPRKRYFLTDVDAHPNPRGYAEIALAVADVLEPPPPAE